MHLFVVSEAAYWNDDRVKVSFRFREPLHRTIETVIHRSLHVKLIVVLSPIACTGGSIPA
jgi:hypothetical protein